MTVAIIQASGFSRRFKGNKLLATFKGAPLFSYALKAATNSKVSKVLVVTQYDEILDYCEKHGIKAVYNPSSLEGQSKSVTLGVKAAPLKANYLFMVADQPFITPSILNVVLSAAEKYPAHIIQPLVDGRPTSPTLFPNAFRKQLLSVTGDQGGREIIRANPTLVTQLPLTAPALLLDIDTREELSAFESLKG